MYLFSAVTLAFYPEAELSSYLDAGTLPADTIEVDKATRDTYNAQAPTGKKLGADENGYPAWIELSAAELAEQNTQRRQQLRSVANDEIEWRQDAVDTDIATEKEAAALAAWKKYRVLLMRVDTAAPIWPTAPEV